MGRPHIRSIGIFCIGLAALIASDSDAFARAGGGGHFSGGGGGHSFGGGGGGHFGGGFGGSHFGGGGTSYQGSGWAPLLVILVLVVLVVVITNIQQRRRDEHLRRGRRLIDVAKSEGFVAQLKQSDPAFDAAVFYKRASDAFLKIQAAWSAQDLRPMQPFVSDGVYERFGLQIREQQVLGYRDRMENVRVTGVVLAQASKGDVFETVTLRIDASAVDYEEGLTDKRKIEGSAMPQPFTEYWSFIRRRGTASVKGNGLIEGNCPNCGGDVSINQNAACAHCGALLRSGQYDWVLCEITQESEWSPQRSQQISGYDQMHAADPGFSTDDLEDRASVIFWRRAEADRTNEPAVLRKVALNAFVEARVAHQKTVAGVGGPRQWFGEIGVGSVDTVGVTIGDDFDRATVQIAWTGKRFSQIAKQTPKRGGETSVIRENFTLCRKRGLKSDPNKGITSAHCPNCGAPISNSLSNACEACGTVLNDGSAGWVLESIDSAAARQAIANPRERPQSAIPLADVAQALPSARGLLTWVIKISAADGEIDAREQKLILQFASKSRVEPEQVKSLIAAALAGRLDTPEPQDRDEVQAWLIAMIDVALADGQLASAEVALLRSVGAKAGLVDADLRLLIKREQARAYTASRDALRDAAE